MVQSVCRSVRLLLAHRSTTCLIYKNGVLLHTNMGGGSWHFVTFCWLAMPFYGCPCKALLCDLHCVLLHFEHYLWFELQKNWVHFALALSRTRKYFSEYAPLNLWVPSCLAEQFEHLNPAVNVEISHLKEISWQPICCRSYWLLSALYIHIGLAENNVLEIAWSLGG